MKKIKFSHRYYKMPDQVEIYRTMVIDVWKLNRSELSPTFIDYDTTYSGGAYPLPNGEVLVILLKTGSYLWTTVRRFIPYKEEYYRDLIGNEVEIVINP